MGLGPVPPPLAPLARFTQLVLVYQRRAHDVGLQPMTPAPPARFA